jgi:twitching motility protein PilU
MDMERDQAANFIQGLLKLLTSKNGSDLFITVGFPPAIKIDGRMTPVTDQPLTVAQTATMARAIMNDRQAKEFEATKECNFAINAQGIGRFRVNVFVQQGRTGMILRTVTTQIPNLDKLGLPPILKEVVMTKRGLVIVVGATGSGKSTTLAAMLDYRNESSDGHIITALPDLPWSPQDIVVLTRRIAVRG